MLNCEAATNNNLQASIRTLDFALFANGDEDARNEFAQELVQSFVKVGFVKLINHGIQEHEICTVFDFVKRFFSLPLEAKNKAAHPTQPNPHRGFSCVGQEILSMVKDYEKGNRDNIAVYDEKESYDQGPADDDMYPNRWPNEQDLPGFRKHQESFYKRCEEVHQNILDAVSIGLGVDSTFLRSLCAINTAELRLNHYPAGHTSKVQPGTRRISEHTDFGTITLLFQDSVGGLEVEDLKIPGRYFPVPCEDPREMVVNVGDCLQRWTNDKLHSTSHRVVFTEEVDVPVEDRYSIAYFGKPNRTQTVGCLDELLGEGERGDYENITAWEYNQRKLLRTYGSMIPRSDKEEYTE